MLLIFVMSEKSEKNTQINFMIDVTLALRFSWLATVSCVQKLVIYCTVTLYVIIYFIHEIYSPAVSYVKL